MDAPTYNASACGTIWMRAELPWWLASLEPSGKRFANEVRRYQEAHGLGLDGKLGNDTLAAIRDTEHLREGGDGDWGPTHLRDTIVVPSAREEKPRRQAVTGVAVHTTGSGMTRAALRLRERSSDPSGDLAPHMEQAVRNLMSSPGVYSLNAYILPSGRTALCVTTDERPVHGGLGPYRETYRQGYEHWRWLRGTTASNLRKHDNATRYEGWREVVMREGFTGDNPEELCGDPNGELWAFDLLPLLDDGKEVFTPAQFDRAAELIAWAADRFGFEPSFRTVLEHRLFNPVTRWPWDPGANWSRRKIGERLRAITEQPGLRLGGDDR